MWNNLKSLSNQMFRGHKGRHFNRTELSIAAQLLDLNSGPEYDKVRKLLGHLSDREVEIAKGVALGKRSHKEVRDIMRQNRL